MDHPYISIDDYTKISIVDHSENKINFKKKDIKADCHSIARC
jgi:hypothetical protein